VQWVPLLLFAGCSQPPADDSSAAMPRAEIQQLIDSIAAKALDEGRLVGLSIAVARDGQAVIAGSWGWLDRDAGIAASPATTFNYASVSKPFTALAILTLVDGGRIGLDDLLSDVLADYPVRDQGASITVRQLLNHTSGLSDYVAADTERWRATGAPLEPAFVLNWLAGHPLEFEPGTTWSYNNSAFYLAGLIVAHASGRSFPEYLREAVTGPLGLTTIGPCDDQPIGTRARGYAVNGNGTAEESMMYTEAGVIGDGGLCGTATDLARMPAALRDSRLLSDAMLTEFLGNTTLLDGTRIAYGLGTRQGDLEGIRVWGHTGGSSTYVAKLARYEERGVSIAVLTNTLDADTDPVAIEGYVAQAVLGLPAPDTSAPAITAEVAAPYVGIYTTGASEGLALRSRITHEGGQLARRATVDAEDRVTALLTRGDHAFGRRDWPRDRFLFHVTDGRATAYSEFYNGMLGNYSWRVHP